jgi:uncharacterized protein DUF1236
MQAKLLFTTAALALSLGAAGTAAAQSSYGDNARGDRSAVQKQDRQDRPDAMTRDRKNHETTGQASDESRNPQGTGRAQAAPKKSQQTTGEGTASDNDRNAANPHAAQDRRSGDMNRPGEAKQNGDANGKSQSAQSPAGQQKQKQQAQTPGRDQRQTSGAAAERNNERSAQQPNASGAGRNAEGTAAGDQSRSRANASTSGQARPERLSASLKGDKATHLTEAIAKVNVSPVSRVDFSVSVGTEVPRTVVLHTVPETVVDIIPEYRDYDYFVVRDQFVIVEPRTHKIVDVIERHGGSRAEVTTTTHKKVRLSSKDRRYLIGHTTTKRRVTTGAAPAETRVTVGEDAPEAAEIETFSPEVYQEVPAVRDYRYIHSGRDVYLVAPGSRRVIEQIDEDDD